MSGGAAELKALATHLAALADRLADAETPDEQAVALAREAAELSATASREIDSVLGGLTESGPQDADPDPSPTGPA
jgi:hypothetical protein